MATSLDSSIGIGVESTFNTGVTPTRWIEYLDESLDWQKNIKQGQGLRVGSKVARSARRVIPSAQGGGDFSMECASKGMGLIWQWLLGASSSTLVSGTTYQQVHTLGAPSSVTLQKGLVQYGGTVDAYTFTGAQAASFELGFPNADIATLKASVVAANVATATAYASPSYPTEPVNLFQFAGGSISSGALTAPTTIALGSGATPIASIRGGSLAVDNGLKADRFTFGGAGRMLAPTRGLRTISGKMDVEYIDTTFRDAVLNDTPMNLVLNFTAGSLSTGLETLQVIVPEIKFDTQLPQTNGTDPIIQNMAFQGLDNLTAAQPLWVVTRTADNAL